MSHSLATLNYAAALHLIPVGLGESNLDLWLPADVKNIARRLTVYIAENAKSARAFLQLIEPMVPIREITIFTLDKKGTPTTEITQWLQHPEAIKNGIGLVSEAGCPAVADPGAAVVAQAHALEIPVYPHVGPSSLLLALMGSGLNGQRFSFQGYLPIQGEERRLTLQTLEQQSAREQSTQLFIETPYRNQALFDDLCSSLRPNTQLCIARALTTAEQWIHTNSIAQWRAQPPPDLDKQPTLFLFLATAGHQSNKSPAPHRSRPQRNRSQRNQRSRGQRRR